MVQPIVELTVYFLLIWVGIVFITGLYFAESRLQLQADVVLSAMSHRLGKAKPPQWGYHCGGWGNHITDYFLIRSSGPGPQEGR